MIRTAFKCLTALSVGYTIKRRTIRRETAGVGSVADELQLLRRGRRTKQQTTWLNYFRTHGLKHRRMDYTLSRHHNMPIGSDAVESAVRRVINL